MYQTICADMHFITGAACAVLACAGQLLGKVKHAGWTVPINISRSKRMA